MCTKRRIIRDMKLKSGISNYETKYLGEPCEEYQVKYRRKKILELIGKYKHGRILEIGCGMEPLFKYFSDFDKMVVIEPVESFVENARICGVGNETISVIQGFFGLEMAEELSAKEKFDFIIVSSLLHEVKNPATFLEAVLKLCDDETIVHINVPNAKSVHRLLAYEMGLISDIYELPNIEKPAERNNVYDKESLRELVEESGFEVIESGTYFPKLLTAGQMEAMLGKGIVQENIFEGLYKLTEYFPEYGSEVYVQVKKFAMVNKESKDI